MLADKKVLRPKAQEVAARLRLLMKALDMKPSEIADEAGIGRNAWSQFSREKDPRLLTLAAAYRLMKFGVSLDWLYAGDMGGMKFHIVRDLNAKAAPIVGRIGSDSQND